jgi:hypothetical protein
LTASPDRQRSDTSTYVPYSVRAITTRRAHEQGRPAGGKWVSLDCYSDQNRTVVYSVENTYVPVQQGSLTSFATTNVCWRAYRQLRAPSALSPIHGVVNDRDGPWRTRNRVVARARPVRGKKMHRSGGRNSWAGPGDRDHTERRAVMASYRRPGTCRRHTSPAGPCGSRPRRPCVLCSPGQGIVRARGG